MISFGSRLDSFKKQAILYIEERVREGKAYRNVPGDLFMCNNEVYIKDNTVGRYKLCTCPAERLAIIADKIHFRPLGDIVQEDIKETNIEKTDNMSFEIKNDIPLPGKFTAEKETKEQPKKPSPGRLNYANLPLRAMKKGDSIVLFDEVPKDKISSRKYTAINGIRRITTIMGMADSFYVDLLGEDKVCVWRVK